MNSETRLVMKLYRPNLDVGTKTFIAMSIMFWVPVVVMVLALFYLFHGLITEDVLDSIKLQLKGAKGVYEERVKVMEGVLSQIGDAPVVKKSFVDKDRGALQAFLVDFGKKAPYAEILIAVDENQKVIARRNDKYGDFINIGDVLSKALLSGEIISSTEFMGKEFLLKEDARLAGQAKDTGIVQFVVSPVRYKEKIVGAIVSGILLTGDPWLGNTIYNRFGVEMALFGGEPPESSFLHSTSSLPRSAWVGGQAIPKKLGNEISLGRPYYGTLDTADMGYLVAYEPIKDSRNRIIGAIGVSRPAAEINMTILKTMGKGVAAGAAIGLIIAVIVTIFIYADINRPLNFLVHAMERVGKGEINLSVDLQTGDQFEKLGTGFNHMVLGIRQREDRLKKHNEVVKLLMSTLNLKELLDRMLEIVIGVSESQMGIVYLYEEGGETLIPHVSHGTSSELKTLKKGEGFPGRAALDNKTYILSPPQDEIKEEMEMGFAKIVPAQVAYIPLCYQDKVLGVLVLGSGKKYTAEETQLFDFLANQISIALDNAIMHHKIQELSLTDTLTGLYNRRYLNMRLEEEWARSVRHNKPLSILLSDADNFKMVNDTYGHDKGDEVLKGIARIVKMNVRKEDLAARYGGEEFVIVLVDTKMEDAKKIAEKILDMTRANIFPWMGRAVTLSIGVATYPDVKADSFDALIQTADQAMYKAKVAGKNRVMISGESSGKD